MPGELIGVVPRDRLFELQMRERIDARVERTLESGLALPEDVEKLRTLANLTKLAINWKIESAAINFGAQFVQLSDEIIGSATNIEKKVEGLGI